MQEIKTLTEADLLSMRPLPPEEMKEYVRKCFAEEYTRRRSLQPLDSRRSIILDMLENPVWKKWGDMGSYAKAYYTLCHYLSEPMTADDTLIDAADAVASRLGDKGLMAVAAAAMVLGMTMKLFI